MFLMYPLETLWYYLGMKNYIGVAAALAVVGIFFYGQNLNLNLPLLNGLNGLNDLNLNLNLSPADPVTAAAWNTFDQYRKYAAEGNLEGVISISHQLSETCRNPESREECNRLMTNVAEFTKEFRQTDFKNAYYDEKQIALVSDPVETADGKAEVQIILFFTRRETGEPKTLGMRFCFKSKSEDNKSCFNSDPATRDLDDNGWWDSVESLFYR